MRLKIRNYNPTLPHVYTQRQYRDKASSDRVLSEAGQDPISNPMRYADFKRLRAQR